MELQKQSKCIVMLSLWLPFAALSAQQIEITAADNYVAATGGISALRLKYNQYSLPFAKYQFTPEPEGGQGYPFISRIEGLFRLSSLFFDYLVIGVQFEDFAIQMPFYFVAYPPPKDGDIPVEFPESEILLRYVGLSVGLKYNFSSEQMDDGVGVQLSFSAGVKLKSQQHSTFAFSNSSGLHHFDNWEDLESARKYRLSLRPELLYDIHLGQRFVLTPRVGYDFSVTNIEPVRATSISMTSAAISLAYRVR